MLKAERKGLVSAPQVTQDDRDPVVCVSWQDTKDFTAWILSLRNEHIRVVTANTLGAAPYLRTRFTRARSGVDTRSRFYRRRSANHVVKETHAPQP